MRLWEGRGAGPQRKTDGIRAEVSFVCTRTPASACALTALEFAVGCGCREKVQPGPSGLALPVVPVPAFPSHYLKKALKFSLWVFIPTVNWAFNVRQ